MAKFGKTFDVEMEGEKHCFKIQPEEATAATAPTAATASTAEPGLKPHSAGSAEALLGMVFIYWTMLAQHD